MLSSWSLPHAINWRSCFGFNILITSSFMSFRCLVKRNHLVGCVISDVIRTEISQATPTV